MPLGCYYAAAPSMGVCREKYLLKHSQNNESAILESCWAKPQRLITDIEMQSP